MRTKHLIRTAGISSSIFNVDKAKQLLTSEYSLVENDSDYIPNASHTISITSDRTNITTEWKYVNHIVNNENEFLYDEFVPTQKTIEENPQLKNYKVIIYND